MRADECRPHIAGFFLKFIKVVQGNTDGGPNVRWVTTCKFFPEKKMYLGSHLPGDKYLTTIKIEKND